MVLDVVNWMFWIGSLLWLLAAIASLWLWGGTRRSAPGHLAAGSLLLASGTLVIHVAAINVYARMDNAYLGNGLFGFYLTVAGATLLMGALAGYDVPPWITAGLWVACAAFYVYGAPLLARAIRFTFTDSGTLLFSAILLAAVYLWVLLRGRALEAAASLALAAVGLALVWWVYGAGTRAFTPIETIGYDEYKPPVLGIGPFVFCLLVATGLIFAGRLLRRSGSRGRQSTTVIAGN